MCLPIKVTPYQLNKPQQQIDQPSPTLNYKEEKKEVSKSPKAHHVSMMAKMRVGAIHELPLPSFLYIQRKVLLFPKL
jgi:hypothetical protein